MFFQAELQHQKRISLFSRQKCHAKLFSQRSSVLLLLRNEIRTIFSLLYSHLRWSLCVVMLLHVARVWAGSFAALVFLHSSILAFRRGIQSSSCPGARASQDLCTPLNYTNLQVMMKVASQRFSTQKQVLGLFHLIYLNGSRTLRGSRASIDRVNVDLYTFEIIVGRRA